MPTPLKKEEKDKMSKNKNSELGNFTLVKHMSHPNGRTSYTIEGVTGNLVIFNNLFADGLPPDTLTLNVRVADPVAKVDKTAEKAERAAERATKAAERLAAQQAKATERAEKTKLAAEAALAKVAAATAAATTTEASA